jgi:hypothetical protein
MSVFLEQWDIHWWDFTVDWMGHVPTKNKFQLTIPFDKRVILKLLKTRVLFLLPCNYKFHAVSNFKPFKFHLNKMAVRVSDKKFGN